MYCHKWIAIYSFPTLHKFISNVFKDIFWGYQDYLVLIHSYIFNISIFFYDKNFFSEYCIGSTVITWINVISCIILCYQDIVAK